MRPSLAQMFPDLDSFRLVVATKEAERFLRQAYGFMLVASLIVDRSDIEKCPNFEVG